MKNKKGILGLDTVKAVIVTLLVLAILAIAAFMVIIPLRQAYEKNEVLKTGQITAETVNPDTGGTDLAVVSAYRNPLCTVLNATNGTAGGLQIPPTNFTWTGCKIQNLTTNYSANWVVNYTFTYNSAGAYGIESNFTYGAASFFTNVPTFFVLLGVIVLILIIAIVILAVTRFSPGASISVGGGESGGGSLESI